MRVSVFAILIAIFCISCKTSDKEDVTKLIVGKIEGMTGKEVVEELLIENGGDLEQIARVVGCSIPTLRRVKNGDSYLTEQALEEIKTLLKTVKVNGSNALQKNDPYYASVGKSTQLFLNKYIWWGLGICFFCFIIGLNEEAADFFNIVSVLLVIVFVGGYLFTFIYNWSKPYIKPEYLDLEKLNPIFETLV